MTNQLICVIFVIFIILFTLAVGGYYTIVHPKQIHLSSCYQMGGSCLEVENCPETCQSRVLTTCIHKRKVCCMQIIQEKNLLDREGLPEVPF